jgi:hypothetical protein
MCDGLQELYDLNVDLQERDMDLEAVVRRFHERQTVPGPYHKDLSITEYSELQGVTLHEKDYRNYFSVDASTEK